MNIKEFANLFLKSCKNWWTHDPLTYSASTAYYAVFSIPGLLIIILSIATLMFDRAEVEGYILSYMEDMTNQNVAQTIDEVISVEQNSDRGILTVITGIGILLFGASGLFMQLQRALNHVWNVDVKRSAPLIVFIKNRATAFGLVVSIGFLLLISLSVTALLKAATNEFSSYFPVYTFAAAYVLHFLVSLGFITILFALVYKVLPDVNIKWTRTLRGGFAAALLFMAGQYGLTTYFDLARPGSAFGAAGSIIVLMLWTFYSCLVLLFGAEYTRVYAEWRDGEAEPVNEIAEKVPDK
jgi:membrane protein